MRRKPPRGGSTSSCVCARACVSVAALFAVWLGGVASAPAGADACPNAAFRSGPSAHLPDCRAYEQVSPVEKAGEDAVSVQSPLPARSAPCAGGETCALAYLNVATAFAGALGNELPDAYLATRTDGGWQTTALTPPTPQAPANGPARLSYAFSSDLSQAVLRVPLQALTEDAPAGVYNLFLRHADGEYSLVTASAPAQPPAAGCGGCFALQDVPAFAGASGDFTHILFEANDSLLEEAPGGGVENLYETVAEHVRLVGILPDGAVAPEGATAGGGIDATEEQAGELANAISLDGSHVLFEAAADGGAPDPGQVGDRELYDRIDGASTVEVSAPAPGAEPSRCETEEGVCSPQPAQFWAASADGSVVLFTSKAALTKASYTGVEDASQAEDSGNDLYRYDVAGGTLTDLSVDGGAQAGPNGASVLGVLGSSQDGSYVYFVAEGRLADGASIGEPNLYVWHGTADTAGTVGFIATLDAPDQEEQEDLEAGDDGPAFPYDSDLLDWSAHPTESQAYVTPDGQHLAFMSVNRLTGYDNEDRVTDRADHEVFEFSAETGQLVCASCDPSGARPLGSAFIGATLTERTSTPVHQPRALSDDGARLFFSSPDQLVPGLGGGQVKVFEYENGGVQLISGTGAGADADDVFLDASASGDDVFFATREQLAPTDADELVDVYDARVDGGLLGPPVSSPSCGSPCQPPSGPPPSFPAPASASLTGSGDLPPPPPSVKLTSRQLLSRALARCRRLRSRRRRAACVAAARRRYAPKAKEVLPRGAASTRAVSPR